MKRAFWSATGEVGTFGMLAPFLIAAGVLAALATSAPGNGFTALLRGTSRTVSITVTDLQGVSQTTVLPIALTTSSP